jgi:hypothetical protein
LNPGPLKYEAELIPTSQQCMDSSLIGKNTMFNSIYYVPSSLMTKIKKVCHKNALLDPSTSHLQKLFHEVTF